MRLVGGIALIMLATGIAQAQVGSGNGTGNAGAGNGNGNGNGNTQGVYSSTYVNRDRRQAPAVLAPGLAAAGVESCLGSASVGGAGPGFGVTIGGTMTDKGCNLRLFSRTLYGLGHRVAATQILCNDPDVAQALAVEGVRCEVGPARAPQPGEMAGDGTYAAMDREPVLAAPASRRRRARVVAERAVVGEVRERRP